MKLFTFDKQGKMIPYKEISFKETYLESHLEEILESNPQYFFERSDLLFIGRQVATNLGSFIDLLAIDKDGNIVIIELKRDKTPRETIAQLLEYASFVENLDYSQLQEIFHFYSEPDTRSLEEYHKEYFRDYNPDQLAFNKHQKLLIVAQDITREIKQTALFLRKKGIDISCLEFKYFKSKENEAIFSSDFVIGDEEFIQTKIQSNSFPRTNEKTFIESLDNYGSAVFKQILTAFNSNRFLIRWGIKGFSMNLKYSQGLYIHLFEAYPPGAVFRQAIYTSFKEIKKRFSNPEPLIELYKTELSKLQFFEETNASMKWALDKSYSQTDVQRFIEVVLTVAEKMDETLKRETDSQLETSEDSI